MVDDDDFIGPADPLVQRSKAAIQQCRLVEM
jgi:hypothetical protein